MVAIGGFLVWSRNDNRLANPLPQTLEVKSKPLDKYTIEALSKTKFEAGEITLGKVLNETANFTSYVFYFTSVSRKVSGLVNVPKALRQARGKLGEYPVILMFRGYVDKEKYTTGTGTNRVGEILAKNGFITLAPDFLGYGESDDSSADPMEERFQTYVTALTLLESVENLNNAFNSYNQNSCHSEPSTSYSEPYTPVILRTESEESRRRPELAEGSFDESDSTGDEGGCVDIVARVDPSKVGIWGHSNGGQIALTILEITNRAYPTVLWAPVSKPFPYSVLYYTDAAEDRGKLLRRVIAEFEKDYDVEQYNLTNYFGRIAASIQIHQGISDESVPQRWSEELIGELGKLEKDVEYFTYYNADHNLLPEGWNLAVLRGIDFYGEKMTKVKNSE